MKQFLFLCLMLVGLTVHGQRFVKYVDTVADLKALNPNDVHQVVEVLGYYTRNDGGGGQYKYNAASTATDDGGSFLKPTSFNGRWEAIWPDGSVNVKRFGAKGDNGTEDTTRVQAAITYAESQSIVPTIYFPNGQYVIDSLVVHKASLRGVNQSGMYNRTFSFNNGAKLVQKIPATGDLISIYPEHMTAIEISNLDLLGNKESNLKNPATITAVSSRLTFTVTTAQLPVAPSSPGTFPYYGECFFYTDGGQYLGSGLVETINYGTGAITLRQYSDHYATLSTASKLLSNGYKVCFASSTTESASFKTTTGVDSTMAGYNGISIKATNSVWLTTGLRFNNLRIYDFHTGIRNGNIVFNYYRDIWINNCAFAGIASAFPGDSRDNLFDSVFIQGFYFKDPTIPGVTLENDVFQRTHWGIYGLDSSGNYDQITIDHTVNGAYVEECLETRVDQILFDNPTVHAIVFGEGFGAVRRPQTEWNTVMIRNGNEASKVPTITSPSYALQVIGQNVTAYFGTMSVLPFGTSRYFDALINNTTDNNFVIDQLFNTEGITGGTLYSASTTSWYPVINSYHQTNKKVTRHIGGSEVETAWDNKVQRKMTFNYWGADQATGVTFTDNTTKDFRFYLFPYANASNPVFTIGGSSQASRNFVFIGGSDSGAQPASDIRFYTGTAGTTTGTQRGSFEENGDFITVGKHRWNSTGGPYIDSSGANNFVITVNGTALHTMTSSGTTTPGAFTMTGVGALSVGNGKTLINGTTGTALDSIGLYYKIGGDSATGAARTDLNNKTARIIMPGFTNAESSMLLLAGTSTTSANTVSLGGGDSGTRPATKIELYTGNRSTTSGTLRASIDETGDFMVVSGVRVGSTSGPKWAPGSGSPEGVVTAPVGALYSRTDGGASTSFYVKESGAGNTGWVAYGAAGSGGVTDGDKGDITVTSSGTVWTIDPSTVTYAKMQNVSAVSKLLGRNSTTTGPPEEITLGSGLSMSGTTLSVTAGGGNVSNSGTPTAGQAAEWVTATTIQGVGTTGSGNYVKATSPTLTTPTLGAATATSINGVTITGASTPALTVTGTTSIAGTHSGTSSGSNTGDQTITLTSDVTGSGTGSFATTISSGAVTYSKMQNVSAASKLLGRGSAAGAGSPQEITIGAGLTMSGTTLTASGATVADSDYGDITVSGSGTFWSIDDSAVTYSKIQDMSVTRLLGRKTASGVGPPEELTVSDILDWTAGSAPAMGDVLFRGASSWQRLAPGTSGQFLQTQGVGSSPQWAAPSVAGSALTGSSLAAGITASSLTSFGSSPTLVTPNIGVATATSVNKVAITAPATSATLTIADGKTATVNNSITFAGTDSTTMTFPPVTASIGYLNVPQGSKSADYTLVLADAGTHIFHPSSDANSRTFTIPANGSVAFPLGTVVTFYNASANSCTLAITTDTLRKATTGTTGSVTIPQYGLATIMKVTTTEWIVNGL